MMILVPHDRGMMAIGSGGWKAPLVKVWGCDGHLQQRWSSKRPRLTHIKVDLLLVIALCCFSGMLTTNVTSVRCLALCPLTGTLTEGRLAVSCLMLYAETALSRNDFWSKAWLSYLYLHQQWPCMESQRRVTNAGSLKHLKTHLLQTIFYFKLCLSPDTYCDYLQLLLARMVPAFFNSVGERTSCRLKNISHTNIHCEKLMFQEIWTMCLQNGAYTNNCNCKIGNVLGFNNQYKRLKRAGELSASISRHTIFCSLQRELMWTEADIMSYSHKKRKSHGFGATYSFN